MTVVLATVWLTVAVLVGGVVTLRLSHDQYSPVSPRRHARVQRDRTGVWRDHDPVEDQPLDLWIGSRKSISTDGWQRRLPNIAGAEFAADKVDYGYEMPETLSREAKVSPSDLLDDPFVADDTFQDQGPGSMEIYKLDLSKEKTLLTATTPSTNLLSRNKSKAPKKTGHLNSKTKTEIKSIISANVNHKQSNFFEEQRTETPLINKDAFDVGGVPELQVGCEGLEASLLPHKTKRSIDTPDKEKGEVPAPSVLLNVSPVSLDLDDVLLYDEEEYEEMDELFKLKKLETITKSNKPNRGDMDASHLNSDHLDEFRRPEKLPERGDLGGSTPINSSELIISQKTKRSLTDLEIKNYEEAKPKREIVLDGDNGASRNHGRQLMWLAEANTEGFADGKSERKRTRRSIDWGFGEDEGVVSSDELQTVNERRRQHEMRYHQDTSGRRDQHHGLNTDIDNVRQEYEKIHEQKRREEENLQQMQQANQRLSNRREEEEIKKRDELRRRQYEEYRKRMNITTHRIDNEDMRRQMEERRKQEAAQMQETVRRNEEELRRREEEQRRLQEEDIKRRSQSKWQEENFKKSGSKTFIKDDERKRRLYDEEMKRREEERRRRLEEEQARRQEQYRSQQEAQRKREEEARRHQDSMRNLSENDRRRLEENRRREWLEKKRQEDEDERRRQPSNLMHAEHSVSHPNDIRQRDRDEKRQQEERQREQKLREYITRNRPINVNHTDQRSKEEKRYRPEEYQDSRMNVSRNDEEYHQRLEEQRKRQEEERKLQDYIRRNQPVNVPSRDNQSTTAGHNWFEERRLIEEARRRDRYSDPGVRRDHGPSAPTYIDPRSSPEEVRRRQQETARRLKEERRQRYEAEERRKELARRQWEEEEERRLRQQRMREEAARREEEARREQSRRYEENRKQRELEVARIQAERRRQEMFKQRSRNEIGRTKQPETRPIYHQNSHLLAEYRRRQDSRPILSNFMRVEEARRAAVERERQRLEAERRQQEESRMREHRQKETDQWRRQELARLNSLPVSARIIVRPGGSSPTSLVSPPVISRGGFNNEIDFTGINPHREGVQVAQFPVPPTPKPPAQSPTPCVWAVVHCCSSNNNRLVKCFESLGCPGINWDSNPCRGSVADAARAEVLKFYANS